MNRQVIQILPTLELNGGTACKVKILTEQSIFNHIVLHPTSADNENLIKEWGYHEGRVFIEGYSLQNPISNALKIVSVCRKYKCRVVHAYFPIDSVSCLIAKILYPKIKIVRSFEGVLPYTISKKYLQTVAFKAHDHFVAISDYVLNFYSRFFSGRLKNISRVYNSPSFELGDIGTRTFDGTIELLSIGGLNPTKNTETMIEAVRVLKARGVEVVYHVLGDGPHRTKVERMIKDYGLENNVVLHGYNRNVKAFLSRDVIYVHPANCEGFGMAVVEAMNYKLPIIVSDSCALPELIEDGVSGYVVETYNVVMWADTIIGLLNDKVRMKAMGCAAYERFKAKFSIAEYVKLHDEIYNKFISK